MAEKDPSSGNGSSDSSQVVCPHCRSPIPPQYQKEGGAHCPSCNVSCESTSSSPKNHLPEQRQATIRPKLHPKPAMDEVVAGTEKDWGDDESNAGGSALPSRGSRGWRWLGIGVVVAGMVAVMTYVTVQFVGSTADSVAVSDAPLPSPPTEEVPEPEEPEQVVEAFLSPGLSVDERVALLRKTEDADSRRKDLEAHKADFESGVDWIDPFGQAQMLDLGIHGFYVHFRSGDERFVAVVEESGALKIDWDAFARTGTTTWESLLAGNPEEAEVRVFVVPGTYYNYDFSDPNTDSVFLLRSPDYDRDLFGYAQTHSTTERVIFQAIQDAFNSGFPTPALMTLRLESVAGSHEHRQFRIAHVVASSWVASSYGTVEDLWVDSGSKFDEAPTIAMRDLGGKFEAPIFYQQGISLQLTDAPGAERYFRRALELQDNFTNARLALGAVLASQNELDAAETELSRVLREDETNAEAYYHLGVCGAKRGNLESALEHFESAIRENRYHVLSLNNVAWLLATHKDPDRRIQPRVVELAEQAAELTRHANPSILATLAVAYAAVSRFEEASTITSQAITYLEQSGTEPDLKTALHKRLQIFEERKPYVPE